MPARSHASPGPRIEVGQYTAGDTERVLVKQRIGGLVRVTDVPAGEAPGRRYLVDRVPSGEVDGLVAVYLEDAARQGRCPMVTVKPRRADRAS